MVAIGSAAGPEQAVSKVKNKIRAMGVRMALILLLLLCEYAPAKIVNKAFQRIDSRIGNRYTMLKRAKNAIF
jgi:hypothetical protein